MEIKITESCVDISSGGITGRFGGKLGNDGFYADAQDFSRGGHDGETSDAERIRLIYDTMKYCEKGGNRVVFLWNGCKPLQLRGDIVVLGAPQRDRLELIYGGRKLILHGDCGGSYLFAAYTGNMEWENGELLSPEEKLGFVRAASESLTGADAIVFLDDDNKSLFIDWRGMPFAHIQDGRLIADSFCCICGTFPLRLELSDPAECSRFSENIKVRLGNGSLRKKSSLFAHSSVLECRYCGSAWKFEANDGNLKWEKI